MTSMVRAVESEVNEGAEMTLPLERCALRAEACAGLARVVLEQHFSNTHNVALHLSYALPLPADAAVSDFAFVIGERRIRGEVDALKKARERFEEAIVQGKTAALLEQDSPSLFRQELGNIPPHTSVTAEIILDVPLAWLQEGMWELRFPLAAAPRYLGNAERTSAAIKISEGITSPRASLDLLVRDGISNGASPESLSHPVQCKADPGGVRVQFGNGNRVPLDRDVVVRWSVARPAPSVAVDLARPAATHKYANSMFALCTIVPPNHASAPKVIARELTLLIDTSGSMQGEPLAQAVRIAMALVSGLSAQDSFELISFDTAPTSWKEHMVSGSEQSKREGLAWLAGLRTGGGTEMIGGVSAAIRTRPSEGQRQIVLITDGLVGFERDVTALLLKELPKGARLHAVGIGESANRALLAPVARAGRGSEFVIGLSEDPDRAAERVFAKIAAPVVTELSVEGATVRNAASTRLPDLYVGSPVRVLLELDPTASEIVLRGTLAHGTYVQQIPIPSLSEGNGNGSIIKFFARERVEQLEMRKLAGEAATEIDSAIERIGLEFQIATRLTSWLAISEDVLVDPKAPSHTEVLPHMLTHGMSAEGLGLASSAAPQAMSSYGGALPMAPRARSIPMPMSVSAPSRVLQPSPLAPPASPPPAAARRPSAPSGAAGDSGADESARAPSPMGYVDPNRPPTPAKTSIWKKAKQAIGSIFEASEEGVTLEALFRIVGNGQLSRTLIYVQCTITHAALHLRHHQVRAIAKMKDGSEVELTALPSPTAIDGVYATRSLFELRLAVYRPDFIFDDILEIEISLTGTPTTFVAHRNP